MTVPPDIPSVLLVHAHPDDESLWTGGLIARQVAAGGRCEVVTCTWSPGTGRYDELAEALRVLGAGEPHPLGYGDRGFAEASAPGRPPFCDSDLDEASGALVAEIRRVRPDIVVTYDAFGVYGHPDHIHAHRLTAIAVEAAACAPLFPDAGSAWQVRSLLLATVPEALGALVLTSLDDESETGTAPGSPDESIDLRLDVTDVFDLKWRAISAHRSELERSRALNTLTRLAPDERRRILGTEYYLRRDLYDGGAPLFGG